MQVFISQQAVPDTGDIWQQAKCQWKADEEEADVDSGTFRGRIHNMSEESPGQVPDCRQVWQCHLRQRREGGE